MGLKHSKDLFIRKHNNVPRFFLDKYAIDLNNLKMVRIVQENNNAFHLLYIMKNGLDWRGHTVNSRKIIEKRQNLAMNVLNRWNEHCKQQK